MPVDENGNLMLYPSSTSNPQYWVLPMKQSLIQARLGELSSRTQHDETLSARVGTDGETVEYWELDDNSQVRFHVMTDQGYPSTVDCGISQQTLLSQGYIHSPKDWKNYEQTGWFEVIDVEDEGNKIIFKGRSGFHPSNTTCCVGTAYGVRAYWAEDGSDVGNVEAFKEEWHVSYNSVNKHVQDVVTTFRKRWFGMKMVIWNTTKEGRETVVIKQFICSDYTKRNTAWVEVNHLEDFVGAGWSSKAGECGAENDDQPIFWGGHFVTFRWDSATTIHFKDLSVREIEPDAVWGTNPNPPPPDPIIPNIDSNGIQWLMAKGEQTLITKSRNNANDFRWSRNYDDIYTGYEATVICTFMGVSADGHCALKMWGGNHTSPCNEVDGGCGSWYDIGIRSNGDIQTQTETVHPSNEDFTPAAGELKVSNISAEMENRTIGLKWIIYPTKYPDGTAMDGGIHIKFYFDNNALLPNGQPRNLWTLALDMIDNNTVLENYTAPQTQEIEMRNSDTDQTIVYKNGLHVRRLRRPEDTQPPPSDGGGGDGGGDGGGNGDGGGGTNPPPITPPSLPSSFKKIMKFKRNIINNFTCKCVGVDSGIGGGGGGGSGGGDTGTQLVTVYNVSHKNAGYDKLGSVSGKTDYFLIYSQKVTKEDSIFVGLKVKQIDIFMAEEDKPRGGTGDGVHVVVRYSSDHPTLANQIAVDFGYIDEEDLHDSGSWFILQNIANEYDLKVGDRICFEYDGGDSNDYVKIFRKSSAPNTGSKVSRRDNVMSFGTFEDKDLDICMTVKGIYK